MGVTAPLKVPTYAGFPGSSCSCWGQPIARLVRVGEDHVCSAWSRRMWCKLQRCLLADATTWEASPQLPARHWPGVR